MAARFSNRTSWDLTESSLSQAIREARSQERSLIDLTISNPTRCGFEYDEEGILGALGDRAAFQYDPDPRGIQTAREAVSGYYAEHGAEVGPGAVVLTTSTSEAYSFLFRLLCDPGDQVLVATPSYPLFDFLATLDDVVLQPYPLFFDFGWWIDFAEVERLVTPRTKAILLVHPNNPTGHGTCVPERLRLEELCASHGLALIVDEVFLDYSLAEPIASFAVDDHACLTFVVSGLSKIAALPQMKVGWLCAFGPGSDEALRRLEVIADTFLSMNAPAQYALPVWLNGRKTVQDQIIRRARQNLQTVERAAHLMHLPVHAGWSVVLELPQRLGSERLAETLVLEASVIVHPASFYGMHGKHRVVASLIGRTEELFSGLDNLNRYCETMG